MKKIRLFILLSVFSLSACELDNYDRPTAGLAGKFIDSETNELVEQDIIRGTIVELREHGYEQVAPQNLVVKNDGSYENSLLFANTYTIEPKRGNFIAVPAQDVKIGGKTVLDFKVVPYIRIKDASITKVGTKVVATFKLQQNLINNIKKIGLYAHNNPNVGEPMRQAAAEQELNAISDPNQTYTIELDLPANINQLKPGSQYYFRIGALIDAPEAKFNYVQSVRLTI